MPSSKYISHKKVKWDGPDNDKILFLAEAPGYDEDTEGLPLVGKAGEHFNDHLGNIGLSRNEVKVGNICNYRPANNDFNYLRDSPELAEGLKEVNEYILKNKPKLVVLLGKEPLRYILGKTGKGAISKWRGSFLQQDNTTYAISNHPSFLNYNGAAYPVFANDFKRIHQVYREGYVKPIHDFKLNPEGLELESILREIENAPKKALDLETTKKDPTRILCMGVAISPTRAFCFYNNVFRGLSVGFQAILERIFASGGIHVWHNGYSFDSEVLYLNGINGVKVDRDTYIQAHALEPEFPLSLAFWGSMLTWESYWKSIWGKDDESKQVNEENIKKEDLMDYCCIDTITDFQIDEEFQKEFRSEPLCQEVSTFEHERLVPVFRHINRQGLPIDRERNALLGKAVSNSLADHQLTLNTIAGKEVNVNSKVNLPALLYNEWQLPHKKAKRKDGTTSTTTAEDAIVSLLGWVKEKAEGYKDPDIRFEWEKRWVALKLILLIRGEAKLLSNYINFKMSLDGRLRSTYKIGPETGRAACSQYVDHTGNNAQTFPREAFKL